MIKWFAANNLVLNEHNEIYNKEFNTFYATYCLYREVYRRKNDTK